jgi:hypothetical protein
MIFCLEENMTIIFLDFINNFEFNDLNKRKKENI